MTHEQKKGDYLFQQQVGEKMTDEQKKIITYFDSNLCNGPPQNFGQVGAYDDNVTCPGVELDIS